MSHNPSNEHELAAMLAEAEEDQSQQRRGRADERDAESCQAACTRRLLGAGPCPSRRPRSCPQRVLMTRPQRRRPRSRTSTRRPAGPCEQWAAHAGSSAGSCRLARRSR